MAGGQWTHGTDRDLGATGNWESGTPTDNDSMYFTGNYSSADTGPNTDMDDLVAIDADLILVTGEYTEPIGTSGAPMEISADKVEHYGQNTLYYKDGDGTTDHFLCDVARSVTGVGGSPVKSYELSGATTTLLSHIRGQGEILANSTVTTMHIGQEGISSPGSSLTIGTGCALTTARVFGGTVVCDSDIDVLEVFAGGRWTQGTATINTALYVFPGAYVTLKYTGTYAAVYHYGGIIDATLGGAKTITNYYRGFQNEDAQSRILGDYLVTKTNVL